MRLCNRSLNTFYKLMIAIMPFLQNQNVKGNGKKSQDSPYVKKGANDNGVSSISLQVNMYFERLKSQEKTKCINLS